MVNMLKVLIAATILLAIIGIGMLGKKLPRALSFKTSTTPNKESLVLQWLTGLVVAGLAIAQYAKKDPTATIPMWTGIIVYLAGGILQLIARKQLHDDKTFEERLSTGFSAAQTGLYSKLRHPNKSALLLITIGFSLSLGSYWALALTAILFFPSVLFRISQEERALLDKFGERWMSYKSETKRIIPEIL